MSGRSVWFALLVVVASARSVTYGGTGATREAQPAEQSSESGFRSRAQLDEHFARDGAELGRRGLLPTSGLAQPPTHRTFPR